MPPLGAMPEEWDLRVLGMVSGIALVFQLLTYFWDKWQDAQWPGLRKPITLTQTLVEWAAYMFLFFILSSLVRAMLHVACSYC